MNNSRFYRTILPLALVILHSSLALADSQKLLITREAGSNRIASITVTPPTKSSKPGVIAAKRLGAKESAISFLIEHANDLGTPSNDSAFSLVSNSPDSLGMSHMRFNQTYKNIPVFGGQLLVHLDQDAQVRFVNGSPLETIQIDPNPKLSEQGAIAKARHFWTNSFPGYQPQLIGATLYIWNRGLITHSTDSVTRLVFEVHLFHSSSGTNERYFIDAHSGELVDQFSDKQDLNREIADCSFGDGNCRLNSFNVPLNYTFGRGEGFSPVGPNPISGSRLDFDKLGTFNSGGSLDTDNIYDSLGFAHNYYLSKFGRNGANGGGGIGDGLSIPDLSIAQSVTRGFTLINWGTGFGVRCPNAFFSFNVVAFCLGISQLDVVAHEYGHAVQNFAILNSLGDPSGLINSRQSGALNEGHSDIFGEAIENFATGSSDWILGEGTPFARSLSDPPSTSDSFGPLPDRFYSPNFFCGSADNFGIHHNLGVFTKAAFLMSEGGAFNGCTVTGLGRDKQERIIFRAITNYFTPTTGFNGAAIAISQACTDLFSVDDCANVTKALRAVEMDQPGRCSLTPRQIPNCGQLDDQCPADQNKLTPGVCGCGIADTNTDGDSLPDCQDLCPADTSKTFPGGCGCGALDTDTNSNGIADCNDVQVQSITPSKPILKAKRRSVRFTLAALEGVRYQLKVQILPRIKSAKKTTFRIKTKSFSGTLKNLPTGQVVVVAYSYLLDGNPPILSAQSARAKVRIK